MLKRCRKCGLDRPLSDFRRQTKTHDGLTSQCRECLARLDKAINARPARKAAQLERQREHRQAFRPEVRQAERAKAAAKKGTAYAPGVTPARSRQLRLERERGADWRERQEAARLVKVAERAAAGAARRSATIAAKPWTDPALTRAQAFRLQYRLDPEFAIKQRLRASAKRKRQGVKIGDLLRSAIKREGRAPSIERFAGFTIPELKRHLERQFDRRMTWQSFCAGDIHIDHIRPLASFDLANPEELRAAWTITNLRPLWKPDNLAKGAKRTHLL